jgi:hypothetical protein
MNTSREIDGSICSYSDDLKSIIMIQDIHDFTLNGWSKLQILSSKFSLTSFEDDGFSRLELLLFEPNEDLTKISDLVIFFDR